MWPEIVREFARLSGHLPLTGVGRPRRPARRDERSPPPRPEAPGADLSCEQPRSLAGLLDLDLGAGLFQGLLFVDVLERHVGEQLAGFDCLLSCVRQ